MHTMYVRRMVSIVHTSSSIGYMYPVCWYIKMVPICCIPIVINWILLFNQNAPMECGLAVASPPPESGLISALISALIQPSFFKIRCVCKSANVLLMRAHSGLIGSQYCKSWTPNEGWSALIEVQSGLKWELIGESTCMPELWTQSGLISGLIPGLISKLISGLIQGWSGSQRRGKWSVMYSNGLMIRASAAEYNCVL